MARRKKKKGYRRKGRKRSAPKKDRSTPLFASGGLVLTGLKFMTTPSASGTTVLGQLKDRTAMMDKLTGAATAAQSVVLKPEVYYPAIGGAIISGSKRIPIIALVARPMDKALKKVSKGKVSL